MPRFSAPLIVIAILIAGCNGVGGTASSAPSPAVIAAAGPALVAATRPSLQLEITGGPGAGSYASDPSSSLNLCTRATDGSWRALYAGGDPWISVDLLVGSRAGEPGRASDVALEITVGAGYLWIDQGKFRGGDAPGRSRAAVVIRSDAGKTTFDLTATTPNRSGGEDGVSSDVSLKLVCSG
jgi:hypothetical protein